MLVLDISKVDIYELWYDRITGKYNDHAKLRYKETQIALSCIWEQKLFSNIFKKMLKQHLIPPVIKSKAPF